VLHELVNKRFVIKKTRISKKAFCSTLRLTSYPDGGGGGGGLKKKKFLWGGGGGAVQEEHLFINLLMLVA